MGLIQLKTFPEDKGVLTVLDEVPFEVKRVFWIRDCNSQLRGGHGHKTTKQVAICLNGYCEFKFANGRNVRLVAGSDYGLFIDVNEWHIAHNFSPDCVLLVLASEPYDEKDYIWKI